MDDRKYYFLKSTYTQEALVVQRVIECLFFVILVISNCQIFNSHPATLWLRKFDAWNISDLALGPDGTIYFTDADYLYAVDSEGYIKWQFWHTGLFKASYPAVGLDGTVYFTSQNCLYAVDSTGKEVWTHYGDVGFSDYIALGPEGNIYCASSHGVVNAFDSHGTWLWKYVVDTGGYLTGGVSIASDGTLYLSNGEHFYAVSPQGSLTWEYDLEGNLTTTSAVIGDDGAIYFGVSNHEEGDKFHAYIYALNQDGTLKWECEIESWAIRPPVIGADGTIYVAASVYLHTISPEGNLKWKKNMDALVCYSGLMIDSEESIYMGSDQGTLFAVNEKGQLLWQYENVVNYIRQTPTIGKDGTIYFIASTDIIATRHYAVLYALTGSSKGLADSPWPRTNHDNANTCCVSGL